MTVDSARSSFKRQARAVFAALATRKITFDLDLVPLHFQNVPLKKIVNWILTEGSVVFKPARPWALPTVVQVEPTSHCNLLCRVCPVSSGLGRPKGNMSLEMFRGIADQLGGHALVAMLWDWGEPFLNPDCFEMIRYLRRAAVKVVCSTNGHVFADRGQARRVVESGADVLVFSVDGITQPTYQIFRQQGDLGTVIEGIRNVVSEKKRLNSPVPVVNLRFIAMKHCEHEIPQLQPFARELGVDILTLRKFHCVPVHGPDAAGIAESLIPSDPKYQLPALLDHGKPVRVKANSCKNLWNCPTIHWDGTVCSCFMDYSETRPLGSLKDQSFREIWRGDGYANLRRAFRKSWRTVPLCDQCAFGFAGGNVGREANAEAWWISQENEHG